MEQHSTKLRLLESIGVVYEQSKACKLDGAFFEKVYPQLKFLSEYFRVSISQSFFMAVIIAMNYKGGGSVEFEELIEYLDCNPMKLLEYSDDFKFLQSKGIFKKQKAFNRFNAAFSNEQFQINEKIPEAILNNAPMPAVELEAITDVIELLEKIYVLGQQRDNEEFSTSDLFAQVEILISSNLHFPLIKKINGCQFSSEDQYLYIYVIWRTITGTEYTNISRAADGIFDNASARFKFVQSILWKENRLISQGFMELEEAIFFGDAHIKLSAQSMSELQEFGLKLFFSSKQKRDNIIEPTQIKAKVLYFNENESKHLDLLKSLLKEDAFQQAQNRMQSKGLPIGITALLHGLPGTGKTATVFQVAKDTNREIVKVDISQSKSMWFGESEKIIKRIFTDYNAYAKDCERMPILLFNEADAIISKRKESNYSNVAQTENTIQNILLEELENFEGIFFATTNLVKNLDSAFERRFLFKIEFQKPDTSVKAKIWHSKMPGLSESECEMLANCFDFSGGQIDNVVRKNEVQEIIHGGSVDFYSIFDFCKAELISKNNGVSIGFKKA